jgi:oxaloacetate decarboxylase beta subunit
MIATFSGVMIIKIMNLFLKEENKINPLIGNSGVSSLPYSARVSQKTGLRYDSTNHLLNHAFGPSTAGVIGSTIAAGLLLTLLY